MTCSFGVGLGVGCLVTVGLVIGCAIGLAFAGGVCLTGAEVGFGFCCGGGFCATGLTQSKRRKRLKKKVEETNLGFLKIRYRGFRGKASQCELSCRVNKSRFGLTLGVVCHSINHLTQSVHR